MKKPRGRYFSAIFAVFLGVLLSLGALAGWKWWLQKEVEPLDLREGLDFPQLEQDTLLMEQDTQLVEHSPGEDTVPAIFDSGPVAVLPLDSVLPPSEISPELPANSVPSLDTLRYSLLLNLQARLAGGAFLRYSLRLYSKNSGIEAQVRPYRFALEASLGELFYLTPSKELRITRMEPKILERVRFLVPQAQIVRLSLVDIQLDPP